MLADIKFRKRTKAVLLAVIAIILVVSASQMWRSYKSKTPYTIGYIGSNEPQSPLNRLNMTLLERAIERINAKQEEIHLQIVRYDTEVSYSPANGPGNTKELYKRYAERNDVLFIVDNSWGQHIKSAATTIRKTGIPVIFLNGDKGTAAVGKRTIFIGSGDRVPESILAFIKKVLNKDRIIFLSEANYALGQTFVEAAAEAGVEITPAESCYFDDHLICRNDAVAGDYSVKSHNVFEFLEALKNRNPEDFEDVMILLNAHRDLSVRLLDELETKVVHGRKINIVAPPYVLGAIENRNYSHIRLYLQTDPMNSISNIMHRELEANNILTDSPNLQLFVNRMDLTEKMIEIALDDERIPALFANSIEFEEFGHGSGQRESVLSSLSRYRAQAEKLFVLMAKPDEAGNPAKTVLVDRIEYYDTEHRLIRSGNFEMIQGQERVPFPWQLNARGEVIPNHIVRISDIDITSINQHDETFTATFTLLLHSPCDLYLNDGQSQDKCAHGRQARQKINTTNRSDSVNILGLLSDYIRITNVKELGQILPIAMEEEKLGKEERYTYIFRITGEFRAQFNLADYPFDKQELVISSQITRPPDVMRITIDSLSRYIERTSLVNQTDIQGWRLHKPFFTRDSTISWFPQYGMRDIGLRSEMLQTFNLRIPIDRMTFKPMLLVVAPLFMIGIASASILFISKLCFEGAGEVSVVIFLTLVTYSLSLPEIIPSIEEANRTNALFILSLVLVVSQFLYIVYLNSDMSKTHKDTLEKYQKKIALSVTFIYVGLFSAILWAW